MEKTKKLNVIFESRIPAVRSTGEDDVTARKGRGWEFFAIATIPLVLVLGNSMLIPILPDLEQSLKISHFQSSLVITTFSVTAGLFIPVLGLLSDRWSRKAIILPSLIIYGAAGILAGIAAIWKTYWLLIVARAIQGMAAAGTAPIAMALVGDMYKGATESKALGLTEASNGTGKVLSPIIGSLLALIVWYAVFFAFPVFCLISILAVIFFIHEPEKETQPPPLKKYARSVWNVFRKKGRWLFTSFFAGALALFTLFGILFYLSDILEKAPYRIDGVVKGLVLAIPLLGMVATSYIAGSVIKKSGLIIRRVMISGLTLSSLALLLTIFFNENIYIFIGLLTLSSIGTGMLLPCLNTMITGSVSKGERGMVTSLYSSLRFFGVALGPPIIGWLMGISERTVFITITVLSWITLLLVFFLIKPDKKIA